MGISQALHLEAAALPQLTHAGARRSGFAGAGGSSRRRSVAGIFLTAVACFPFASIMLTHICFPDAPGSTMMPRLPFLRMT